MTSDTDYLNILTYGKPQGTIKLKPYSEEVIEVDPRIISAMKSKLRREDTSNLYDISDRVIDELSLAREKRKLSKVIGSIEQVSEAFSSVENIAGIQEEMTFEEVDKELLSDYSFVQSHAENVDEVDFLKHFLFGESLITKNERNRSNSIFQSVIADYQTKHFDILRMTKEVIEMNPSLARLFRERKLVGLFDELLLEFYGNKL
ncbi:MAG: hypothetical protein ACJAT2_003633 [Bacteriovoracaceae bacterium]|jgi:hypothetical protein